MPFGRRGIVCHSLWCVRQICLRATVQGLYSKGKSRYIWRLCRQVVNGQGREIVQRLYRNVGCDSFWVPLGVGKK
jgi:hypothetical protein